MIDFDLMKLARMVITFLFGMLICLVLEMSMGSCTRSVYVPVENVKHDTLRTVRVIKDTIMTHDSVYVKESGDTIFYYKWKVQYKSEVRVDTIYVSKCDTIQKAYKVVEEKEVIPKSMWGTVLVLAVMLIVAVGFIRYKL